MAYILWIKKYWSIFRSMLNPLLTYLVHMCASDRSLLFVVFTAIGFNVETVQYNNIKFQVWDLGLCSE